MFQWNDDTSKKCLWKILLQELSTLSASSVNLCSARTQKFAHICQHANGSGVLSQLDIKLGYTFD